MARCNTRLQRRVPRKSGVQRKTRPTNVRPTSSRREGPGPEVLKADIWSRLPEDIVDLIPIHIPEIGGFRSHEAHQHAMSRLSLVNHTWARHIRPSLFLYLQLVTSSDLRFLHGILQSPLSRGLCDHIGAITLEEEACNEALARQFTLIFPQLTSLKTIEYAFEDPTWDPRSGNLNGLRPFPAKYSQAFHKLPCLTNLELNNQKFPSFSDLVRLLKSIPSL